MRDDDPAIADIVAFIETSNKRPFVPAANGGHRSVMSGEPAHRHRCYSGRHAGGRCQRNGTSETPVALIAGSGALPFAVAESLKTRGIEPIFYRHQKLLRSRAREGVSSQLDSDRTFWAFDEVNARRRRAANLIFIGSLIRPALSEVRLDWTTMRMIPAMIAGLRGGDDHLLSATAGIFERGGFRLLGLKDVAPDLLMPEGKRDAQTA